MRLVNKTAGGEILADVKTADTVWRKTRGLLGRRGMEGGEGLVIPRCRCVHTFFMKFSIGLIFVDDDNTVVSVRREIKPWRIVFERRAAGVIECSAGSPALQRVGVGDRLETI